MGTKIVLGNPRVPLAAFVALASLRFTGLAAQTSLEVAKESRASAPAAAGTRGGGSRRSFLGLGLGCAQNAPKNGAGLHSVRGQGGPFLSFKGGEFSTGTTGNLQPELTAHALTHGEAANGALLVIPTKHS